MEKYIGTCKRFQMYNCNSPQGMEFTAATIETHPGYFKKVKIVVIGDDVYTNSEKDYAGVMTQRVTGGKWEKKKLNRWAGGVEGYLSSLNAKAVNFRGSPRIN